MSTLVSVHLRRVMQAITVTFTLAALAGLLALGTQRTGPATVAPELDPAASSVTGIDVSAHQHPNGAAIDWARVVRGIRPALGRAGR